MIYLDKKKTSMIFNLVTSGFIMDVPLKMTLVPIQCIHLMKPKNDTEWPYTCELANVLLHWFSAKGVPWSP